MKPDLQCPILLSTVLFFALVMGNAPAMGMAGMMKVAQEKKPNVLLICVDDLRPELKSFGVDYIRSPNIDELASRGRAFHRHYVQAPTCGASRFTLLSGRYGSASNGALFSRAKKIEHPSFPAWFRQNGYTTVSVGKVSHHPGGRGGPDWDDSSKLEMPNSWDRHLLPAGDWQHPRGAMHGLAHGEIRKNSGEMDLFQSTDGPDSIYPDGLIAEESLKQLETLAKSDKPFLMAVGFIRPHLPFGAPAKYMQHYRDAKLPPIPHPEKPAAAENKGRSTWHRSGEFMKYNRWDRNPNKDSEFALEVRKHYAACVTYADAQVGKVMQKLNELDLDENTIVIFWGDHGWHLGEHAIWGKHSLYEESLRSPLIISYPGIKQAGKKTMALVETLDLFPTVCELAGVESPDFVQGTSVVPILDDPNQKGHPAISYKGNAQTIRSEQFRLIIHPAHFELFDHSSSAGETKNVAAEKPEVVKELADLLKQRLDR